MHAYLCIYTYAWGVRERWTDWRRNAAVASAMAIASAPGRREEWLAAAEAVEGGGVEGVDAAFARDPSSHLHGCTCMGAYAWVHTRGYTCMGTHAWVHVHGCIRAGAYAWVRMHGYTCIGTHAWVHMHGCTCMSVYAKTYIVHMYVYAHA